MQKTNFPCPICDTTDHWLNVDEHRLAPVGMEMCTVCGFVTYPKICSDTDKLADHYRGHDYREAPTVNNLFAGERKLHYHGAFLNDLFEAWKKAGKAEPEILEIGAATGMVLHWIRSVFPKAHVRGTELTRSFRRNAWWMYKVILDEKPDLSKKYDLLIAYKVAEHIPGIDKELRKWTEALADGGLMYISVPTWFNELSNPGMRNFDLGFYYDTNHVNVWSRPLFDALLKKCGLEVVKENHTYYNDTYLCRRNDALMSQARTFDDIPTRISELKAIKKAALLALEGKWAEAVKVWPNFPDANVNMFEMSRSKNHQLGFEGIEQDFIKPALANCPNSAAVANHAADLYMRYERYDQALEMLKLALELRVNDPPALLAMAHCFRNMSLRAESPEDATKLLHEARQVMGFLEKVSKQCAPEAITWVMQDNAKLPTPHEFDTA